MNSNFFDSSLLTPVARKPLCVEDMGGILRNLIDVHLPSYNNTIAVLLQTGCEAITHELITHLNEFHGYLTHVLVWLYKFPSLCTYRPVLLLCCIEIERLRELVGGWQYKIKHDPSFTVNSLLFDATSSNQVELHGLISSLYHDFMKYRMGSETTHGLVKLLSDTSIFTSTENINSFQEELIDIGSLLDRCDTLYDQCKSRGIDSIILSYMRSLLLAYMLVCRPQFIEGLLNVNSHEEYGRFRAFDTRRSMLYHYYDGMGALDSTAILGTSYYYGNSSNPSLSFNDYVLHSDGSDNLESQSQGEERYISLAPDGKELLIYGSTKQDYEKFASLEEEVDALIIRVKFEPDLLQDLLSDSLQENDRQKLLSFFENRDVVCRLKAECDNNGGFCVRVTDTLDNVIQEIYFSPDEVLALQSNF